MRRPVNLSRRPLRNERLPTLLLGLGCLALVAVTVQHAFVARSLLPERTADVDGTLVELEQELDRLRRESADLARRDAPRATLEEWGAVRRLVDRRTFSWSGLLGCLEEVTPPNVRLLSIAPRGEDEVTEVSLRAAGRTVDDGYAFLSALLEREEFRNAFLNSVTKGEGEVEFSLTVVYVPVPRTAGETS